MILYGFNGISWIGNTYVWKLNIRNIFLYKTIKNGYKEEEREKATSCISNFTWENCLWFFIASSFFFFLKAKHEHVARSNWFSAMYTLCGLNLFFIFQKGNFFTFLFHFLARVLLRKRRGNLLLCLNEVKWLSSHFLLPRHFHKTIKWVRILLLSSFFIIYLKCCKIFS